MQTTIDGRPIHGEEIDRLNEVRRLIVAASAQTHGCEVACRAILSHVETLVIDLQLDAEERQTIADRARVAEMQVEFSEPVTADSTAAA